MKISQAFQKGLKTVWGQKTGTLKLLLTEFALALMCLAPLLFLTEGAPLMYLAALSVPMWLLIKVPARLNAAAAMQDSLEGGEIFSLRLADTEGYGKKVLYGLKRLVLLALWGAPLAAALLYAWDKYAGDTDGLTVMQMVYDFGGGDMKTGMIYLILIFLALVLLFFLGMGFHSGDRHAEVIGQEKLLKGRRPKVLLCRICSLVFLLPLIIAFAVVVLRYLPLLNDVSGVMAGEVSLPSTKTSLLILGIGALLTLPLVPLRSMVTAAFIHGMKE